MSELIIWVYMHYIDGEWYGGLGEEFSSFNPATREIIWSGRAATQEETDAAIYAASKAFEEWSHLSLESRIDFLQQFGTNLKAGQSQLAETISKESGKPLWESNQEVLSMIRKIPLSIQAYKEKLAEKEKLVATSALRVRPKPHGVIAVFGPFNLPGHLPNGHIIPALLAGNTIVFKGSELAPSVSEQMLHYWYGLPKGVLNLVQGGSKVGHDILTHPRVDGLFFTGSYRTGEQIHECWKLNPEKILVLEMGGNNPLVVTEISNYEAAAYLTIQSAFITAGQRCSCARRLIVPEGAEGDHFLDVLIKMTSSIQIGPYTQFPEPFMGPVIHQESAESLLTAQATLGTDKGICLVEMKRLGEHSLFLTPGIMDVSHVTHRKDEELFGPFLQVIRVPHFEAAIEEANQTAYGLCAALFCDQSEKFEYFYQNVHAGIINWNMPTTGASSEAPFGGVGKSGNHRASGYEAALFCSYPVTTLEQKRLSCSEMITPGIK